MSANGASKASPSLAAYTKSCQEVSGDKGELVSGWREEKRSFY